MSSFIAAIGSERNAILLPTSRLRTLQKWTDHGSIALHAAGYCVASTCLV